MYCNVFETATSSSIIFTSTATTDFNACLNEPILDGTNEGIATVPSAVIAWSQFVC